MESSLWTNSEEYCYVWERLDTKFGLSAFQLTPLEPSTGDTGSSLWRTPNGSDVTGGPMNGERRLAQGHQLNLAEQAATPKLWPTPSCGNFNDGESLESWEARRQKNLAKGINGNGQGTPLGIAAKLGKELPEPSSGSLNPRFVEELMGFEIEHTALKP